MSLQRAATHRITLAGACLVLAVGCPPATTASQPPPPTVVNVERAAAAAPRVVETQPLTEPGCHGSNKPKRALHDYRRAVADMLDGEAASGASRVLALLGDERGIAKAKALADEGDVFSLATMAMIGDRAARQKALRHLAEVEGDVVLIATAFARRPHPTVTAQLKRYVAATDPFDQMRMHALSALSVMNDRSAIDELKRILRTGPATADDAVIVAHGLLPHDRKLALPPLEAALRGDSDGDLAHAASAFAHYPRYGNVKLLSSAYERADNLYDRMWLAFAILRGCGAKSLRDR